MPNPPTYPSQVWDHLGLVAGRFDERGMGDVLDQATHQHPDMRDRTVGEAVNAMGLNGLGGIPPPRPLAPRSVPPHPPSPRVAPRVPPAQLHDDARGRALETLDADGVPARSRLLAVSAATRLGLCPTSMTLDTTSVHVEGHDQSDAEPEP